MTSCRQQSTTAQGSEWSEKFTISLKLNVLNQIVVAWMNLSIESKMSTDWLFAKSKQVC